MKCWKSKKCQAGYKIYKNRTFPPTLSHRHSCNGYPIDVTSDKTTTDQGSKQITQTSERYEESKAFPPVKPEKQERFSKPQISISAPASKSKSCALMSLALYNLQKSRFEKKL